MISKAEIMAIAEATELLPTTIEKDYVLGWILSAVAQHQELGQWLFKGGTCLKKCYFDTYRFSEDLDFTVLEGGAFETESILENLHTITDWVSDRTGIQFPEEGISVKESVNKRGMKTYEAKVTFVGPLGLPRAERQRIKFDLTRDELAVDPPEPREVFHGYSDAEEPRPRILCYSLNEILAEKTRALYERSGRARDVYDIVNVGRNYLDEVSPAHFRTLIVKKFEFKGISHPSVELILSRVAPEILVSDWANSLRHQLPVLPPVEDFLSALREILESLLEAMPVPVVKAVSGKANETTLPRLRFATSFPARSVGLGMPIHDVHRLGSRMDRIRFAARNRLLARVAYHGVNRLVESYSLRQPATGNQLLYVFEVERGAASGGGLKAFKVDELGEVDIADRSFHPRYLVEL